MLIFKGDEVCTIPSQLPPQALRFSQGRGVRLVMSRKEPWEGYTPVTVVPFPPLDTRQIASPLTCVLFSFVTQEFLSPERMMEFPQSKLVPELF